MGRVVQLYHDECAQIWGSSPAVQPTIGLSSASPIPVDTEVDLGEGDVEEAQQINNGLDQSATSGGGDGRRAALDRQLQNHRTQRLQGRLGASAQNITYMKEAQAIQREQLAQAQRHHEESVAVGQRHHEESVAIGRESVAAVRESVAAVTRVASALERLAEAAERGSMQPAPNRHISDIPYQQPQQHFQSSNYQQGYIPHTQPLAQQTMQIMQQVRPQQLHAHHSQHLQHAHASQRSSTPASGSEDANSLTSAAQLSQTPSSLFDTTTF